MGVRAFTCALVALFALDSITTYLGLHFLVLSERNPLVAFLIPLMGRGIAMTFIFVWKLFFLRLAFMAAQTDETRLLLAKRVLLIYGVILGISWLTILLKAASGA